MAALAHHDLIGFDRETPALRSMIEHFPSLSRQSFALRADSNLAQLALIRAGYGIGICNCALTQTDPTLVRVLAQDVSIPLGIWIVMHEDLKTSASCRTTFNALVVGLTRR